MYGCDFSPSAMDEGVIDIDENVLKSYAYLKALGAE
jgi:hypothetical protein